jgi:DNA-directed RNA polymerase subunit RPC12/RpoP
MVQLKCKQCGATLEREESTVVKVGDTVIIRKDAGFKCRYCGAEYSPGEESAVIAQTVTQVGKYNVNLGNCRGVVLGDGARSVTIFGSSQGNRIITGDGVVIIDE